MSNELSQSHDKNIKNYATVVFLILIAVLGFFMMTLTSSPLVKGAAFLWLPAALQLIAGVWLGPWRGLIAGGLGAYLAGILAYGGFGLPDIIMNPIAGGFANSLLPAFMFSWFNVNPDLGSEPQSIKKGSIRILVILSIVIAFTIVLWKLEMGLWGYLPSIFLLLLLPFLIRNLKLNKRDFLLAFTISVVISLISAAIGWYGMKVGGMNNEGALISAAGWFLGDVVSCQLGLYILASFSNKAKERGLI